MDNSDGSDKSYDNELISDEEDGDTLHQRLTYTAAGMLGDEDDEVVTMQQIDETKRVIKLLEDQTTGGNKQDPTQLIVEKVLENFKLDVFRQSSAEKIVEPVDYYLRVYVLTCQNLSAMNNSVQTFKN